MNKSKNCKQMGVKIIFLVSILMAGMLTISLPAMAADWPNFRNEASNSADSPETIQLPLTEQWHSSAPSVEENGAVVSNGIVYMSTDDSKLYAFNVSTGSVVSGYPVTTAFNYGAPAVDAVNQKVYVLASSTLYAFNLDGTSAWSASVGSTGTNYNQGPVIDGGYVYIKAGNTLKKYSSSGTLQWSSSTAGMNTQPAIMGDYVYINTESGQIRKYNKATGYEVTTGGFPISTGSSRASISTANGKVFHKSTILYAYNANNGSLLWSMPDGGYSTYSDSPAVSNGVVYTYGWDGKIYAFDENTGATMSGFPSVDLNPGKGRNWGSPTVAGDKVFIGAGQTQKVKVLGAAGSASPGVVLAEYLTFSTDTQGFDLCSVVISDGVVFAMLDGGGLYAFFSSGTTWTGGAIVINNGDECTESQTVTLALDRGSNTNVNQMRISENPFFTGAVWETYSTTKTWTLSAGYGTKTVYVQFKDSFGQLSNVFNDQIEYSANCGGIINTPPVADPNGPYTGNEGSAIILDGSASSDPDAGDSIVSYEWDLDNDGTYDVSGVTVSNTWADDYSGTVVLKVTDSFGANDTASTTVTVNNVAPAVTLDSSYYATVPITLRIAGQGSDGNSVALEIIQDGNVIASDVILREPGSPDEQTVTISATIDLSKPYSGRLVFDTETAISGGTPVWLVIDDEKTKVTTFTTQKKKPASYHQTYDFDMAGLVSVVGKEVTFSATATDPGTDDMTFDWDFGDSGVMSDFYPWSGSHTVTDTVTHTYSSAGSYTVGIVVTDDDSGVGTDSNTIQIS